MVQFVNPAALWLLGLIVPVVLFYLLKRRRREVTVPSILLWKQAFEDHRVETPFQKLRSSLLLLLQILILVLLAAILSGPYIPAGERQTGRRILVLDISASMQATDQRPDRFTAARNRLLEMMEQMLPEDEVMLMTVGAATSVLHPFTTQHTRIRSLLSDLGPQDAGTQWQQCKQILATLHKHKPQPKIVIASDFSTFSAPLMQEIPFDPIIVGNSGENIAFTRIALQPIPDYQEEHILFFQIRNFGAENHTVEVQIHQNRQILDALRIQLGPDQTAQWSLRVQVSEPSQLELRLQPDDALNLDNDIILYAEPRKQIAVLNRSTNPFLQKALNVLPSVFLGPNGEILIDNGADQPAAGSGIFFLRGTSEAAGQIVQWDASHPALQFVEADLWHFTRYSVLSVPPGAHLLMEAENGPVAYEVRNRKTHQIVLGFALEDSNIHRLAGFPVFLQNAITRIETGLHPPLPQFTSSQYPEEGLLKVEGKQSYLNFVDAEESRIAPQAVSGAAVSQTQSGRLRHDLSSWLLLFLIAVIMLEWWAFHRKVEA